MNRASWSLFAGIVGTRGAPDRPGTGRLPKECRIMRPVGVAAIDSAVPTAAVGSSATAEPAAVGATATEAAPVESAAKSTAVEAAA